MIILLIDDDERLTDTLSELLQGDGHMVCVAHTDKVALEWAFSGDTFDLAISDWDLGLNSKMNGGEVVEGLRRIGGARRYIIMSGLDRDVPEGVEFYSKMDLHEMLRAI